MCLYPRKYVNQKYTCTKKNGGNIPLPPVIGQKKYVQTYDTKTYDKNDILKCEHIEKEVTEKTYDKRVLTVQIPCGCCIECCKQKANAWRVRMIEELKMHKYNYFVTLTFSNDELKDLRKEFNLPECNAVAKKAVRRHLERWRKDFKCQLKHWYITEMGHENTERIHLHGILFCDTDISEQFERIAREHDGWRCNWKYWKYGHIWVGDYCTSKTINYIVKYMTKLDTDHKGFYGEVLCSPGIGRNYTEREIFNTYRYIRGESRSDYRLQNGARVKLPTYYKNKAYEEEERELIWRESMDRNCTVIMGNEYDNEHVDPRTIGRILNKAQEVNRKLGYGDDSQEWRKKSYNVTERMLQRAEKKEKDVENYKNRINLIEKFGGM